MRKQLVTNIMTQNFRFGYTTDNGNSQHRVIPFEVSCLYPTTMAHIEITQQAEDRENMMTVSDNNNAEKGPPPIQELYTELFTVLRNLSSTPKGFIWHQLPAFHTSQGNHHNSQSNVSPEQWSHQ